MKKSKQNHRDRFSRKKKNKPTRKKEIDFKNREVMFSEVQIGDIFLFKSKKERLPLNGKAFTKVGILAFKDGMVLYNLKKEDTTKKVVINM